MNFQLLCTPCLQTNIFHDVLKMKTQIASGLNGHLQTQLEECSVYSFLGICFPKSCLTVLVDR